MQGLKLSRIFYHEAAEALLQKELGADFQLLAAGLVGEGSECFGFDDKHSRDHDFGAGFCLWLRQQDKESLTPRIEAALARLPRKFMGFDVRMHGKKATEGADPHATPVQSGRVGIFSIEEFYARFTNAPTPPDTWQAWYTLPEHFLAVCTNGDVFFDGLGEFSRFRNTLLHFYPEDVRKKKLAARLGVMAQSGQYNLLRSLQRSNLPAAYLACTRFVENAVASYFLIHQRYMPFYKWAFTSLEKLPQGKDFSQQLQELMSINLLQNPQDVNEKIEDICLHMVQLLQAKGLSTLSEPWLMAQAQYLQDSITHPQIQGLPLLHGVSYS